MAGENSWEDGGSREHQDPPTDAVWYVADEDTQLGPLSVAEVEERCNGGELDGGCMVWSVGMSDWLPLADVPELSHLAPVEEPVASTPVRLTDDESWTPISAEELAALAAAVPAAPAAVHHEVSRDLPEVRPAGFGDPVHGWSVPVPPPASGKPRVPLAYAAGLGGAALVGAALVGALVALFFAYEVAPPASGVSEELDGMRPHSDVSARGSGGHALDPTPVAEQAAGAVEQPVKPDPTPGEKVDAEDKRRIRRELCAAVSCSGHGRCVVRAGQARCSCDTGYRNAGPSQCVLEPKEPKDVLDKDAIKGVVAAHKPELVPCLTRAKKPGGVAAGRYSLVVSWMIRADGSVGQVRWARPDWARSTSLPECFASVIRSWKFPAPGRDFAVNNFPLGNVNLK